MPVDQVTKQEYFPVGSRVKINSLQDARYNKIKALVLDYIIYPARGVLYDLLIQGGFFASPNDYFVVGEDWRDLKNYHGRDLSLVSEGPGRLHTPAGYSPATMIDTQNHVWVYYVDQWVLGNQLRNPIGYHKQLFVALPWGTRVYVDKQSRMVLRREEKRSR